MWTGRCLIWHLLHVHEWVPWWADPGGVPGYDLLTAEIDWNIFVLNKLTNWPNCSFSKIFSRGSLWRSFSEDSGCRFCADAAQTSLDSRYTHVKPQSQKLPDTRSNYDSAFSLALRKQFVLTVARQPLLVLRCFRNVNSGCLERPFLLPWACSSPAAPLQTSWAPLQYRLLHPSLKSVSHCCVIVFHLSVPWVRARKRVSFTVARTHEL